MSEVLNKRKNDTYTFSVTQHRPLSVSGVVQDGAY